MLPIEEFQDLTDSEKLDVIYTILPKPVAEGESPLHDIFGPGHVNHPLPAPEPIVYSEGVRELLGDAPTNKNSAEYATYWKKAERVTGLVDISNVLDFNTKVNQLLGLNVGPPIGVMYNGQTVVTFDHPKFDGWMKSFSLFKNYFLTFAALVRAQVVNS